ncbi:unnamed protein product [Protopolystoma xenopodis]|uniref:RNA-polymerase II-associated protein 3-like C-terminal domain-containing protein n=1 Tax=Protopolystoma xenopodis TaxID=117903 RepID=A0A3S5B4Q4_9PLAT|nr:unnamed protein product [Protopolystoma xenopodis]
MARALCRKALDHHEHAQHDLEAVLKRDPKNRLALDEYKALTGNTFHIQIEQSLEQNSSTPDFDFRRIPIVEVGADCISSIPKISNDLGKASEDDRLVPPGDSLPNQHRPKSTSKSGETTHKTISSSSSHSLPTTEGSSLASHSEIYSNPRLLECESHTIPNNWFQMERDLRDLITGHSTPGKCLPQSAVTYICRIPATSYSHLIGQNLDGDFLSRLLQAFYQISVGSCHRPKLSESTQQTIIEKASTLLSPSELAERLIALTELPRFDVAAMLLDDQPIQQAQQIIKWIISTITLKSDLTSRLETVWSPICSV